MELNCNEGNGQRECDNGEKELGDFDNPAPESISSEVGSEV